LFSAIVVVVIGGTDRFLLLIGNKIEQLVLKLSQESHFYFKHIFKKTF